MYVVVVVMLETASEVVVAPEIARLLALHWYVMGNVPVTCACRTGEAPANTVLEAGALAAASIATNEEWKAQRPAQVSALESELAERVRAMLSGEPSER